MDRPVPYHPFQSWRTGAALSSRLDSALQDAIHLATESQRIIDYVQEFRDDILLRQSDLRAEAARSQLRREAAA